MASAASSPDFERQQHARRIERIEKPERVADQHPAVAGHLRGAIGIVLGREVTGRPRGAGDALLDRRDSARLPRR